MTSEVNLSLTGRILLACAGAIVVSLFLPWSGNGWFEESAEGSTNTLGITTQMLWDTTPATLDGQPLVIPLAIALVALIIGALQAPLRWLAVVGSAAVVLIALLFLNGLRAIDSDYDLPGSMWSTAGIGTWLALVAGAGAFVLAVRGAD